MRRICITALAAAAAMGAPATAAAAGAIVYGVGAQTTQQIPVQMSGRVIVRFHGDAGTGCDARGLCGYSGTLLWTPPPSQQLSIQDTSPGSRTRETFRLFPSSLGPGGPQGGVTNADVTRAPFPGAGAGTECVDAASTQSGFIAPARGGRVRFSLGPAPMFATRCAGPRDGSILPLLPSPQLPARVIRRGQTTVSFAASRTFAADGFAGTISSDVTAHLGRPGRVIHQSNANGVPGTRRHAVRVRFRVMLSGSVVERVAADADPGVCVPLGACGATGSVTIHPGPRRVTAAIDVVAPPGKPAPQLAAAAARGTSAFGAAFWGSAGTLTAAIAQDGAQCTDSATLRGGLLTLGAARGRLVAGYSMAEGLNDLGSLTGCPGPTVGGNLGAPIATGTVPIDLLAQRRITIRLTTGNGLSDYGYAIQTAPDLTLTLTRVSVRPATLPGP